MGTEFYIEQENGRIKIVNAAGAEKFSAHLWRRDDVVEKNKERVYLSGWSSSAELEWPMRLPGTYFAKIYVPDKAVFVTNEIEITADLYTNGVPEKNTIIDQMRKAAEQEGQLMQKMYTVGSAEIIAALKAKFAKQRISIFAPTVDSMRIGNMLLGSEFFDANIHIHRLLGHDRTTVGYKMSATFRQTYEPLERFVVNESDDQDVIVTVDSPFTTTKDQELLDQARAKGTTVVSLTKIVDEAFNNKVIVKPLAGLAAQGAKVVVVRFPRLKEVKQKTAAEEQAAKTAIAKVRQNLKQGIYPETYQGLGVDEVYMDQVLDGWELINHPQGFDTLKDKTSTYVNVKAGHRVVPAMADVLPRLNEYAFNTNHERILFFGNSVTYGIGSDDAHTVPNLVAQTLMDTGRLLEVQNLANFSMNDYVRAGNLIKHQTVTDQDVVVFGSHLKLSADQIKAIGGHYLDMQAHFERPHKLGEVFIDMTHMNQKGYQKVSDVLTQYLLDNALVATP